MARFETSEVLLTTRMSEIFLRLLQPVLPWNATLRKRDSKSELIQVGHASSLTKRQPSGSVEAAGQFDLHMPLAFARPEREAREGLLVKIKSDAHKVRSFRRQLITNLSHHNSRNGVYALRAAGRELVRQT